MRNRNSVVRIVVENTFREETARITKISHPRNMIYECGTRFHFRVLKNLGSHAQLIV